jgi:hypothetical protein
MEYINFPIQLAINFVQLSSADSMERNQFQPVRPQPDQAEDAQQEHEHATLEHVTSPVTVSTHESPESTLLSLSNTEAGFLQPTLESPRADATTQAAAIWLTFNCNDMYQEQGDGVPDWIVPESEESQFEDTMLLPDNVESQFANIALQQDDAEYPSDDEAISDSTVSGETEEVIREPSIPNTDVQVGA